MYNPEQYRQERERIRATMEASRTPEGREKAAEIRARRAEWNALSNDKKQELEELDVFREFAAVSGRVDPGSGVHGHDPEPDIRCTVQGTPYYFELGEITAQSVARVTAAALKHNEVRNTGGYPQDDPLSSILDKKAQKIAKYETYGAPVELLLYYRNHPAPLESCFLDLLAQNADRLRALVLPGRFRRVWIFDFNEREVLWQSEVEPEERV